MDNQKWTHKVGDFFTIEREICIGAGMDYYLLRLEGGLALVSIDITPHSRHLVGVTATKAFVFRCLRPGRAAIQFGFLHASDPNHILYEQVLPMEIEANDTLHGGWSPLRSLTDPDKEIFQVALKGFVGVTYEPQQVATQVVAGTNYSFICRATTSTHPASTYTARIVIFAPLPGAGQPLITSIMRLPEAE